jgi:hypothetical protein
MTTLSIRFTGYLLTAALLVSCASSPPPIPPELQYQAPVYSQATATISGSQENSTLLDDFTAFVLGVDGKRVMTGRAGWKDALGITEGTHRISVAFKRGAWFAFATLDFEAKAGSKYQLRHISDAQATFGNHTYCDFWIADVESGKPVTSLVRAPLANGDRGAQLVPIYVPARK